MLADNRIEIRQGWTGDVFAIGRLVVETWQSAFRGILDDEYLDRMSPAEQAVRHMGRRSSPGVGHIVAAERQSREIVGFANFGPARGRAPYKLHELYALYVRPDFQGKGIGADLVRAVAQRSMETGAASLFAWVLAANPNRAFYERLGAVPTQHGMVSVGGKSYPQIAYVWNDLAVLANRGEE
ncbi:MAG: GNAT family N-acetyltransferase [Shinella sp.]|jgi:GNAT superfamily N-acetyltransferase|nr:GNAT family N-acetyltransferase [Shinella sp.]